MKVILVLLALIAFSFGGYRGYLMAQKSPSLKASTKKAEPKWPDTTPPDKTDPYWESNNNLSSNGVPYRKVEVAPGKWQWQEDKDAIKYQNDYQARKSLLWTALRTRVLTDKEWKEVLDYGDSINIPMMNGGMSWGYNATDKQKELNDAYVTQQRLRLQEKGICR